MSNIILTTPDELRAIVGEAVAALITKQAVAEALPDTITLSKALDLLAEYGYPTSRAKIYKLTSAGTVPHRKFGNKLVFSRKEILEWADKHARRVGGDSEDIMSVVRSARRKG